MKQIRAFRKEHYGLFIDLEDAPASLAVNPRTGEILLNEGDGPDRFDGAAISIKALPRFEAEAIGDQKWDIVLAYGNGRRHVVGRTDQHRAAQDWIAEAERLLEVARRKVSASAPVSAT